MSVTFATFLFVPLAVWAAFRTNRTVAVLAGTVGFSATAVLNIGAINFAVQPYHLMGLLVIVRALLDARVRKVQRLRRRVTWVLYALGCYWLVALVSVVAHPPGEATTFYMVSQLGHLGFAMAVCWAVSRVVRTPETLQAACRGFERGAVFIAAWGVMQFAMDQFGGTYPAYVFNNSIGTNVYAAGTSAAGSTDLIRAASVATEPSFLGRTLVLALGLLLVRNARASVITRRWMVAGALMITMALLFANSSTGLFGLALLVGAGLFAGRRLRVQRFAVVVAVSAALVPLLSPSLTRAIVDVTLGKGETGSFKERTASIELAKETFRAHPVLGVGWGNLTSHDLPMKVLSNTGVLGAACLLVVLFGLLTGRVLRDHVGELRPVVRALKLTVALSVAMDWVAGWSYPYGDIWVLAGLLLAAFTIARPADLRRDPASVPASAVSPEEPLHREALRTPAG